MMFRHPHFLWLLPLVLLPLLLKRRSASFGFSSTAPARAAGAGWRAAGSRSMAVFRSLAIALAVLALARPQAGDEQSKVHVEGIAIELVVDQSGSMAEADMLYEGKMMSRLDAAKRVIGHFVKGRKDDLIGLTAFSAYPNEVCPLTLDYGMLEAFFGQIRPDNIFPYTAIGDGILQASELLKASSSKSKVLILLTDGVNNFGVAHPVESARMAAQVGIKIYAIGMTGRSGRAEIDEEMLRQVAAAGGGRYYSAADGDKLKEIYEEIDRLEKTEQVTEKYLQYRELYHAPLAAALGFVFVESFLGITFFRKKP